VVVDLPAEAAVDCLAAAGFVFLYAPRFHPALRQVAPVRRELGIRTIFNLVGPLVNPAGVRRQLVGVFDAAWVEPMARTLQQLGCERAWVVHGAGGIDELSLAGASRVAEVDRGKLTLRTVTAADAGLAAAPVDALRVGSTAEAASHARAILEGERGPGRDVVLLNAAAALVIAGAEPDLRAAAGRAARVIDSGAARRTLDALVTHTRRHG
jgi:anthranilate phosphoribosyltransferase